MASDPLPLPDPSEIRELAGRCYLAMRSGERHWLQITPSREALRLSRLDGMFANLCLEHGVEIDRGLAVVGMQLSMANAGRWEALKSLLAQLPEGEPEPVLFKGGVMHARWPRWRGLRAMYDYDLITSVHAVERLRGTLERLGFNSMPAGSRLSQRLSKGWMVWRGQGLTYQNLDVHARVTEPPVCDSLTQSILATRERADGVRVPDVEDCVCMIALHIARSGMYRPLREYIDLLWYVESMDESRWDALVARARHHHLLPALFAALRQALHCLALAQLAPERATALASRVAALASLVDGTRLRLLDWLAPPDYPLHPKTSRNHPLFRRSITLGAATSSLWRVGAAFLGYGAARFGDHLVAASQGKSQRPQDQTL